MHDISTKRYVPILFNDFIWTLLHDLVHGWRFASSGLALEIAQVWTVNLFSPSSIMLREWGVRNEVMVEQI